MKIGRAITVHRRGFTLIELLVVLVIIIILASLLMPAIHKALRKGKMTKLVNNGRNLYTALLAAEIEGDGGILPYSTNVMLGAYAFNNSTDYWRWVVTNGLMDVTFEYWAADGVPAYHGMDPDEFTANNNAWCAVADIGLASHEMVPMFFTRNLNIDRLDDPLDNALTDAAPFGSYGVIVVNKGGSTRILKADQLEDQFNPTGADNVVLRP